METPRTIDARGMLCPLPVLKARKELRALPTGACLRVLTDDPAAVIDMPHFCSESGHELVDTQMRPDGHAFTIRKGG